MKLIIRIRNIQLTLAIFTTYYPMRKGIFTHMSKYLSFINIHPTTKLEIGIQLLL